MLESMHNNHHVASFTYQGDCFVSGNHIALSKKSFFTHFFSNWSIRSPFGVLVRSFLLSHALNMDGFHLFAT